MYILGLKGLRGNKGRWRYFSQAKRNSSSQRIKGLCLVYISNGGATQLVGT